ncbi:hypothetical protein ACJ72_05034 [Emergomyces africanus]|uniref:Myb-like domain-containing protein n=1 Tax=Emergomyces africanus TaxID=1955775 RepID=A0A1B7NV31_9EURO|nr:hypothetical protein ACJ72_05034 [Emergomyces africanus]
MASNKKNMRAPKRAPSQVPPLWTSEECERFLNLRSAYPDMTWGEFQLKFYPDRTSRALQQRLYARRAPSTVKSPNPALPQVPRRHVAKVADVLFGGEPDDSLESDSGHDDTADEESFVTGPVGELNQNTASPNGEVQIISISANPSSTLESQHRAVCPTNFSMDSNKLVNVITRNNEQPSRSNSNSPSTSLAQITEYDMVYILREAKRAEVYKSMLDSLRVKFSLVKPEVDKITSGCSDIIQSKFGRSENLDTAADTIGEIFREIDAVFKQAEK